MLQHDCRTLRHRLVTEIGEEGQRKIASRVAHVKTYGLAAKIEARYLAIAGFRELHVADDEALQTALAAAPDACVMPSTLNESSVKESSTSLTQVLLQEEADLHIVQIVEGALRALMQIRDAIE